MKKMALFFTVFLVAGCATKEDIISSASPGLISSFVRSESSDYDFDVRIRNFSDPLYKAADQDLRHRYTFQLLQGYCKQPEIKEDYFDPSVKSIRPGPIKDGLYHLKVKCNG